MAALCTPGLLPVPAPCISRMGEKSSVTRRGSYLILYHLPKKRLVDVGGLGKIPIRQGYYIYVGSAMKSLSKRVIETDDVQEVSPC